MFICKASIYVSGEGEYHLLCYVIKNISYNLIICVRFFMGELNWWVRDFETFDGLVNMLILFELDLLEGANFKVLNMEVFQLFFR